LNLVAFNALMARRTGLRLDLTQEGLYSITPATSRLLASLDDDVLIHGYFSQRTHPKLAPLVPQIEDLLSEYAALSHGRVKYEILDPNNDEMAQQEANDRFGVNSTPFRLASKYETGIVNAYFALVIQRGDQYERYGFDELIAVDRLPDGDADVHLRNLEYDLTRAIKKVVYGFNSTADLFAQVEAPVREVAEVEVHFGSAFAPGFFAWVVPISADRARIGTISRRGGKRCLADFLAYLRSENRLAGEPTSPRYGGIPLRPLKQTYAARLLVVGDAAGQVKPLTGGGVYYALLAADIAADVLDDGLRRDDLSTGALAAYQRRWHRLLKRELDYGYAARRVFEHLSDSQISRFFAIIDGSGVTQQLAAAKELSFDWHAAVIRALAAQTVRSPRRTGRILRAILPG
jgi:hypothetical protein